jgi:FAD/FMN-containing dehydrogenase
MTELEATVDSAARDLPGVERASAADGAEYGRSGQPFAVVSPATLEVRLDPVIAAAARRTPDVVASARRPGWIAFSPPEPDRFALDRARAWFEAAWRFSAPDPARRGL